MWEPLRFTTVGRLAVSTDAPAWRSGSWASDCSWCFLLWDVAVAARLTTRCVALCGAFALPVAGGAPCASAAPSAFYSTYLACAGLAASLLTCAEAACRSRADSGFARMGIPLHALCTVCAAGELCHSASPSDFCYCDNSCRMRPGASELAVRGAVLAEGRLSLVPCWDLGSCCRSVASAALHWPGFCRG